MEESQAGDSGEEGVEHVLNAAPPSRRRGRGLTELGVDGPNRAPVYSMYLPGCQHHRARVFGGGPGRVGTRPPAK